MDGNVIDASVMKALWSSVETTQSKVYRKLLAGKTSFVGFFVVAESRSDHNENSSSPSGILLSPATDRNPSPPPRAAGEKTTGDVDAIGDTVYSKHWLFSTLTRLIQAGLNTHVKSPLSDQSIWWPQNESMVIKRVSIELIGASCPSDGHGAFGGELWGSDAALWWWWGRPLQSLGYGHG